MKTEDIGGPLQGRQARLDHRRAVVGGQRGDQHVQVGAELRGVGVRRGRAHFLAQDIGGAQLARRGGQARVDADQRAAVRFVAAVRRIVGRERRQVFQRGAGADHQRRNRQFGAQRMDFFQIKIEDGGGVARKRVLHRAGIDVGVAVAVAADPAAHLYIR